MNRIDLKTVETPVAVVDRARMEANAQRVVDYCRQHGLTWRPHIKTHKSRAVARRQLELGAAGLTVATPREAEVMAEVSSDLLLAYPPVGEARLERVLGLPRHVDLKFALDSDDVLGPLAAAARQRGREVGVLVEVDVGLRRVGVQGHDRAVALAEQVARAEGVSYRGILFYAGHVREPGPEADEAFAKLASDLDELHQALSAVGLRPSVVSGGTTPTLWRSHELPHLTEIRPGTCIFNDRDALNVGAADREGLAYTVLATVVSTSVEGRAAVDAGSKALAKEPRGGAGTFGFLLDHPEVDVVSLSEEHGMLDVSATTWRPTVGERVRIVPNHVCVSVNLQDRLLVANEGSDEAESWPIEARGRGPWEGVS
jgi:D-serine deaminase-like pyridoxal phosphate-dependent protein